MIQTDLNFVLTLLMIQGVLGALDTLYYHEWKYRLPALWKHSALELKLHAIRDLIYACIFILLPQFAWHGMFSWLLLGLLLSEIIITCIDFVIERKVRAVWGGLANGELIMHTCMAILYGAFLLALLPHVVAWSYAETQWASHSQTISPVLIYGMSLMGIGVFFAGMRDLLLSFKSLSPRLKRYCMWPWSPSEEVPQVGPGY